jgi:cobalamin transport system ATP-binding protein
MARPSCAALFAELAKISPYFAVGTGPYDDGWRPVAQLYTDTPLLDALIAGTAARMHTAERRVAASTFFLGFAARLWSIGLGAVAGHRMLPDLNAQQLLFRHSAGRMQLHIAHPVCQQGDDLEPLLADMVIEQHMSPLTAALRRHGPISTRLLRGNAVSALLGAARVFDREATGGRGWQLARRLCADQRLSDALVFDGDNYRRTSCCLYYRAPGGSLCGDCVLTSAPRRVV